MGTGLAEYLDEQIGGAVDHPGVLQELGGRVDDAVHLYDPPDPVEAAELLPLPVRTACTYVPAGGGMAGSWMSSWRSRASADGDVLGAVMR